MSFRYRRRDRPIVADLDLTFPRGRTILLGPNGAGKSTVLALAASVLSPDKGRITIDDRSATDRRGRSRYRQMLGWMPQRIQPASGVTVREQVALHGWLVGQSRADAWSASGEALRKVNLGIESERRAARLSGGQLARMGLAQALVHEPPVLLLDEPTAALDPDQRAAFLDLVRDLALSRTIVVSTHDVGDIESTYENVVVLHGGRTQFTGSVDSFLARAGESRSAVDAYRAVLRAD